MGPDWLQRLILVDFCFLANGGLRAQRGKHFCLQRISKAYLSDSSGVFLVSSCAWNVHQWETYCKVSERKNPQIELVRAGIRWCCFYLTQKFCWGKGLRSARHLSFWCSVLHLASWQVGGRTHTYCCLTGRDFHLASYRNSHIISSQPTT